MILLWEESCSVQLGLWSRSVPAEWGQRRHRAATSPFPKSFPSALGRQRVPARTLQIFTAALLVGLMGRADSMQLPVFSEPAPTSPLIICSVSSPALLAPCHSQHSTGCLRLPCRITAPLSTVLPSSAGLQCGTPNHWPQPHMPQSHQPLHQHPSDQRHLPVAVGPLPPHPTLVRSLPISGRIPSASCSPGILGFPKHQTHACTHTYPCSLCMPNCCVRLPCSDGSRR